MKEKKERLWIAIKHPYRIEWDGGLRIVLAENIRKARAYAQQFVRGVDVVQASKGEAADFLLATGKAALTEV